MKLECVIKYIVVLKLDTLRLRCVKNCYYCISNDNDNNKSLLFRLLFSDDIIPKDLIVRLSFSSFGIDLKYKYRDIEAQSCRQKCIEFYVQEEISRQANFGIKATSFEHCFHIFEYVL